MVVVGFAVLSSDLACLCPGGFGLVWQYFRLCCRACSRFLCWVLDLAVRFSGLFLYVSPMRQIGGFGSWVARWLWSFVFLSMRG